MAPCWWTRWHEASACVAEADTRHSVSRAPTVRNFCSASNLACWNLVPVCPRFVCVLESRDLMRSGALLLHGRMKVEDVLVRIPHIKGAMAPRLGRQLLDPLYC